VGFRPFVYGLARDLKIGGWVRNSPQGVIIEAQGSASTLQEFARRLVSDRPPLSLIDACDASPIPLMDQQRFEIVESCGTGLHKAMVLPDVATCRQCVDEINDRGDRRYRYPFTNCTHCGPRYSIIQAIPYDRCNTTMSDFGMCPDCEREYTDPKDRRFHAQPVACPACGPHLELWDARGAPLNTHHDALIEAARHVREGRIVAVKGLGGFHLIADATNESAVRALRTRKRHTHKPFAVMLSTVEDVAATCEVSPDERVCLASTAAPIVLLSRESSAIVAAVAPDHPTLGVMLPYTPLHHMFMAEVKRPVVATSGNIADEPMCITETQALDRLAGIADVFLVHNRPIQRQVDDSIVQVVAGKARVLRRARGYAPLPIPGAVPSDHAIVACGGHLKNAVAVASHGRIFLSQHIGDLDAVESRAAFDNTVTDLATLLSIEPRVVACDQHPDYYSTRYALAHAERAISVQHHHAHVAACMAEHGLEGDVLGIAWDGTGYGDDRTIWGGEFLRCDLRDCVRVGHLRQFSLPGGDRAAIEPRRAGMGLLFELFGSALCEMDHIATVRAFSDQEQRVVASMMERQINAPRTSSMGRLFDAVASLLDLQQGATMEGRAAALVQFTAGSAKGPAYPIDIVLRDGVYIIDWEPMVRSILSDAARDVATQRISARFHATLVDMIARVACNVGLNRVVLSGGCFHNARLLTEASARLRANGFEVFAPEAVPAGDGGLAVGQAAIVAARCRAEATAGHHRRVSTCA
jgi:hydrogenase maturation protein HypF